MPDLSNLPAYLSLPFLLVFAVLLLISRFLDVFEKWDAWSAKRAARKAADKNESSTEADQEVNETEIAPSPSAPPLVEVPRSSDILSAKQVFGYAYVGAIAIPLVLAGVYRACSVGVGRTALHELQTSAASGFCAPHFGQYIIGLLSFCYDRFPRTILGLL